MLKKLRKSKVFKKIKHFVTHLSILGLALGLIICGFVFLWFTTLKIPDLDSFDERILGQSTKIFDKTGKILLYDFGQNMRRTVIPLEEIPDFAEKAAIAIEDAEFYSHHGIKITSIIRATLVNITTGEYSQGGSTITQQVIKNSLLTKEKTISRKIKEMILALKLERVLTKEEILHLYLNEAPYGGTIYGIEEAAQVFFGKKAKEITLAQSAYLAALPQAPTYFSPYGKHKEELTARKNLVLEKMIENKFITKEEYDTALKEEVVFQTGSEGGIKAPHFVMFIREYLEEQYGERVAAEGGLRVTTTLDFELQKKAEEIVNKFAIQNEKQYKASNASLVAIDAKTGHILTMVGSRDYFDKNIDGNYNIATAKRQPGSSFKPFIYLKAFEKGYRPETVLFDLRTQFSTNCEPTDLEEKEGCYSPSNYDDKFRGPMTLRSALAQSVNVPAVKLFYLVGMKDTIDLVRKLGITTIIDPKQYGLSLVLGGGEVTLLEMTGAYAVFSQNGERNPTTGIIKIEDKKGNIVEEWKKESVTVLPKQPVLLLNNVLSDNQARVPAFSPTSPMYFPDRDVAAKTGTTNDYRDTWIVGYTPSVSVGAWAGNNNNSSIDKKVAGYVVAPMWRAFMDEILKTTPDEKFEKPESEDLSKVPPVIRGVWQGSVTETGDTETVSGEPHSILHWINKDNPLGGITNNPWIDSQYSYWEYPIRIWSAQNGFNVSNINVFNKSNITSNKIYFSYPTHNQTFLKTERIKPIVVINTEKETEKVEYFLNGVFVTSTNKDPFEATINLSRVTNVISGDNTLKVVVTSKDNSQETTSITLNIN